MISEATVMISAIEIDTRMPAKMSGSAFGSWIFQARAQGEQHQRDRYFADHPNGG